MPLHRRLPKRGFNNIFAKTYSEVSLGRLQKAIDDGKLDPKATINLEALKKAGLVRSSRNGVRVLGNGELKAKVTLEVAGASKPAAAAIEKAGGSIKFLGAVVESAEQA
jgi:large subunit ribosomal protein L15